MPRDNNEVASGVISAAAGSVFDEGASREARDGNRDGSTRTYYSIDKNQVAVQVHCATNDWDDASGPIPPVGNRDGIGSFELSRHEYAQVANLDGETTSISDISYDLKSEETVTDVELPEDADMWIITREVETRKLFQIAEFASGK